MHKHSVFVTLTHFLELLQVKLVPQSKLFRIVMADCFQTVTINCYTKTQYR